MSKAVWRVKTTGVCMPAHLKYYSVSVSELVLLCGKYLHHKNVAMYRMLNSLSLTSLQLQ